MPREPVRPKIANILVVEDDPGIRLLIGKLLERDGYKVESVPDGKAAIERLTERVFDVVLLDVMMPGVSGIEVARHLSVQAPAFLANRVIIVTALSPRELSVFDDMLACTVVRKPFDIADLTVAIRGCLSRTI